LRITRRQFLQYCTASAAALGLSQTDLLKLEEVLATPNTGCSSPTPSVIWLSGQACTACQISMLNRVAMVTGGYYDGDMIDALYSTASPLPPPYPQAPVGTGTPADPVGLELDVVKDVADLVVGDAVSAVVPQLQPSPGSPRAGWAPFPNGYITLEWISTTMAGAGELTVRHLQSIVEGGPFILLLDGSIPTASPSDPTLQTRNEKACFVLDNVDYPEWPAGTGAKVISALNAGPVTLANCLRWICDTNGANCLAAIATGTCSSYGGIPAAQGSPTGATSMEAFFAQEGITTPVVNVPGCPPHPDWMVYPVAYYLIHSALPELDQWGRPKAVFSGSSDGEPFCYDCPNKPTQGTPDAAQELGDSGCLGGLGCKGPYTFGDCPVRQKNTADDGTLMNWCVGAQGSGAPSGHVGSGIGESRHPCQGCIQPDFPDWSGLTTFDQKTNRKIKGFYNP